MTVHLPTDNEELVTSVNWYHAFTLADGTKTPGRLDVDAILKQMDALGLPQTMTGMRVLDVETNDGGFAFACERRGADVVALDPTPSDAFAIAATINGSALSPRHYALEDMRGAAKKDELFDVIIASGWLYRQRDPMMALTRLRHEMQIGGLLFIDTLLIDGALISDIDSGATLPLTAHAQDGMWQMVDWVGADDAVTLIPSLSGLKVALRKAGFLPIGVKGGQDRATVAAVAYGHRPRSRAHGALVDVQAFTHGALTMWTRHDTGNGHYALIDQHVVRESQTDYFQEVIDYASVKRAIDGGAHIGAFTRMLKTHSPDAEIVCVEPDERSFVMLELNTAHLEGVERINGYLGYDETPQVLVVDAWNTGGNRVVSAERFANGDRKRLATVALEGTDRFTLDFLVARARGDVDLLKLDCEGAEIPALLNIREDLLKRIRYIVGEYHTGRDGFQACVDRLSEWFDVTVRENADVSHLGMFVAVRKNGVYGYAEGEIVIDTSELADAAAVIENTARTLTANELPEFAPDDDAFTSEPPDTTVGIQKEGEIIEGHYQKDGDGTWSFTPADTPPPPARKPRTPKTKASASKPNARKPKGGK